MFKLWKGPGGIAESRSVNPKRIVCELYAKLLAMLVQHWLMLVGTWARPDRSLTQAAGTIRQHARQLAGALSRFRWLCQAIRSLIACLGSGCRMNRRRASPNLYQLLLGLVPDG